ncbi:hypothetical protein N657DRAFT_644511 [Parathielavia appendiculata]|uniref:Letm1 RBD domain-containing protein n=1 Tax=Parathielavia appendiculata TaxID=2587402 RepID=A0AAN6Z448_9PEZI|nr:hypothetical protein N657DRAFT_644511 [Parathielavia appendiculata]
MRHSALIGSALRVNGLQLPRHRAQPRAILHSLSHELSRTYQRASRRPYPSASPNSGRQQPPTTTTSSITTAPTHDLAPSAANPPPTTRPPPLDLPPGPPDAPKLSQPYFSYLLALGKAYLRFYKIGMKHIWTNTRLLYSTTSTNSDLLAARPAPSTRAHLQLRERVQHDLRRLPLFAAMLIVCGEFTPLVVLALPGAVPLPCRIPRQVEKLLAKVEARRAEGREELSGFAGTLDREVAGALRATTGPMAKVLGLSAPGWMPKPVLGRMVDKRLGFLAEDDALLVQAGGAAALLPEEVRLACADRGINVLGRGDDELRGVLGRWLRLTDARRLGEDGRRMAVMVLLGIDDSKWDNSWEREFPRLKD